MPLRLAISEADLKSLSEGKEIFAEIRSEWSHWYNATIVIINIMAFAASNTIWPNRLLTNGLCWSAGIIIGTYIWRWNDKRRMMQYVSQPDAVKDKMP